MRLAIISIVLGKAKGAIGNQGRSATWRNFDVGWPRLFWVADFPVVIEFKCTLGTSFRLVNWNEINNEFPMRPPKRLDRNYSLGREKSKREWEWRRKRNWMTHFISDWNNIWLIGRQRSSCCCCMTEDRESWCINSASIYIATKGTGIYYSAKKSKKRIARIASGMKYKKWSLLPLPAGSLIPRCLSRAAPSIPLYIVPPFLPPETRSLQIYI